MTFVSFQSCIAFYLWLCIISRFQELAEQTGHIDKVGLESYVILNIYLYFVYIIRDQAGRLSFRDLTPATTIQATKEFPLKIDKIKMKCTLILSNI